MAAWNAAAASPDELLEKGIYTEETRGDLKAASQIYQQIAEDPEAQRNLVAQAQLRLGFCELKLGNKPQAISALERLTQEFPDKDALLAVVEKHMPLLLEDMLKQIEQNYIQEVDRTELMETALRAIVGKLDSRSSLLRPDDMAYLTPEEAKELNLGLQQKIAGIGAILGVDDSTKQIKIISPLPGSPALKAGLRGEDRIIEVNGAPIAPLLANAVKQLRGRAGSLVILGIQRTGSENLLQFEVLRDNVLLASVRGYRYKADQSWDFMFDENKKIGYIRLTQVGRRTPEEMEAALRDLNAHGMKALILDLRDNPGGALDQAVATADLFVESGRIVTVKGRREETVYDAKAAGTFSGFPMALLVNRNTASAAEIIASCLQDHRRAIVVGERTFGQALVRTILPLKGGLGSLKIPIAAYYRPNGKTMNRYPDSKDSDDWGVTPDAGYEVAFTEAEAKEYSKFHAERANNVKASDKLEFEFQDRQLEKAIDYLDGQAVAK
jgi:carboxyl-terminal processing protease